MIKNQSIPLSPERVGEGNVDLPTVGDLDKVMESYLSGEPKMVLSGPMFEPSRHNGMRSVFDKQGGHYNVFYLDCDSAGRADPEIGMRSLRGLFPTGEANEYNVALFSTSGIHGTYITIEEIEASITKYGEEPEFGDEEPDDYSGNDLTVLVIHPRTVCTRCGNVRVRAADIPWLKKLRASSWAVLSKIGAPDV